MGRCFHGQNKMSAGLDAPLSTILAISRAWGNKLPRMIELLCGLGRKVVLAWPPQIEPHAVAVDNFRFFLAANTSTRSDSGGSANN